MKRTVLGAISTIVSLQMYSNVYGMETKEYSAVNHENYVNDSTKNDSDYSYLDELNHIEELLLRHEDNVLFQYEQSNELIALLEANENESFVGEKRIISLLRDIHLRFEDDKKIQTNYISGFVRGLIAFPEKLTFDEINKVLELTRNFDNEENIFLNTPYGIFMSTLIFNQNEDVAKNSIQHLDVLNTLKNEYLLEGINIYLAYGNFLEKENFSTEMKLEVINFLENSTPHNNEDFSEVLNALIYDKNNDISKKSFDLFESF